ncbi:hypothetical protein LC55x_2633 [Lysobacter capsici]|nr:hypothetical protein LC55x_2633 [Lysobacter capsici]
MRCLGSGRIRGVQALQQASGARSARGMVRLIGAAGAISLRAMRKPNRRNAVARLAIAGGARACSGDRGDKRGCMERPPAATRTHPWRAQAQTIRWPAGSRASGEAWDLDADPLSAARSPAGHPGQRSGAVRIPFASMRARGRAPDGANGKPSGVGPGGTGRKRDPTRRRLEFFNRLAPCHEKGGRALDSDGADGCGEAVRYFFS